MRLSADLQDLFTDLGKAITNLGNRYDPKTTTFNINVLVSMNLQDGSIHDVGRYPITILNDIVFKDTEGHEKGDVNE